MIFRGLYLCKSAPFLHLPVGFPQHILHALRPASDSDLKELRALQGSEDAQEQQLSNYISPACRL